MPKTEEEPESEQSVWIIKQKKLERNFKAILVINGNHIKFVLRYRSFYRCIVKDDVQENVR